MESSYWPASLLNITKNPVASLLKLFHPGFITILNISESFIVKCEKTLCPEKIPGLQ